MAGHHGKRSSQTANQHLSPHTHLITILSEIPMGYFSLVKKKTNDIANKDANMGFTSTKVGSSFCQASPELDQSPRKRKPTSFKPPLSINTDIASAFTPPLTPSDSSQSRRGSWGNSPGKRGRDKSAGVLLKTPQSTVESTITPPQSPSSRKSGGTTFTRRTSLTSLSLLKTPRQRKLQEIRQGKLPAISPEIEIRPSTSSDDEPCLTEICDPSSSTTYSPSTRLSNKKNVNGDDNPKDQTIPYSTITSM